MSLRTFNAIIIVGGIWFYPFISYFMIRFTKNNELITRKLIYSTFIISGLTFVGLLTQLSFTISSINYFFVSSLYLSICHLLNFTQFQENKIVKILGSIGSFLVFGFGFIVGSIGLLGLGFILGDVDVDYEKWLGNGIIYREFYLGNALSDFRGKRIEISKTISWFPVIEHLSQEKKYSDYIDYYKPLNINFDEKQSKLYLSQSIKTKTERLNWTDTLILK
jgi:hypothetical protein